jgi:hypothetical protein
LYNDIKKKLAKLDTAMTPKGSRTNENKKQPKLVHLNTS